MKSPFLTLAFTALAALPAAALPGTIYYESNVSGNYHIYSMTPTGTGVTQLTNTTGVDETSPAVSQNGSQIAYTRSGDVWYANANGTGQAEVPVASAPSTPEFEPGTNLLSYSRVAAGVSNIYSISPTGTGEKLLVGNSYNSYYGQWSPDGTKILYYADAAGSNSPDIFVANADGSGQVALTTTHMDENPVFSPDGGQIAWQSKRDGGGWQVYIMNADGSEQRRLSNDAFNDTAPAFAPDEEYIAFASDRLGGGKTEIYQMTYKGTGITQVTSDAADDDTPAWGQVIPATAPSASVSDATVTAPTTGMGSETFTVTLSAAATYAVTAIWENYDITAVASKDYTMEAGTVSFAPGVTSGTFSVPIDPQTVYNPTKTYSVRICALGVTIARQAGIGTIVSGLPEPSVAVAGVSQNEGTSGTAPFNFPVTLSAASSVATTVNYATANGTALAGTDYAATSGTLTIPAGSTTGVIAVPVDGSTTAGPSKTFTVTLSAPANATLGTSVATGTILNPNATPGLSLGNASANEGSPEVFTLTLTSASTSPITVTYATVNGSGLAGVNYVATNGSVTIPAGQLTANVTVNTLAVSSASLSKGFTLNVSSAPGAVITGPKGVGTIVNTVFPKIYLNSVSLLSGNTATREMYFSLCLSDSAPFPVTFSYATSDGTAVAGKDYTAQSGVYTLPSGQNSGPLGIVIYGTTVYGPNKTFTVTLSAPVNGTILTPTSTGTIIPSAALPSLSAANLTVVQPVSGTTPALFHVTLSNPSTSAITVNYATAAGTAVAGTDFTSASGTITFPAGTVTEPVTITVLGHASPKNGATFTLNLSSPSGATVATPSATCTLATATPAPA